MPVPAALYLPFDEPAGATVAADASGNGRDAAQSGGVTFGAAGRVGLAASFDGVNDLVKSTTWGLGKVVTAAAWVNPAAITGATQAILGNANGLTDGFLLYVQATTGKLAAQFNTAGVPATRVGLTSLSPGVWTHVAVTFDGETARLYVNGVQDMAPAATTATPGTLDFAVGAALPGSAWYGGLVDDVRVYPMVLTPAELAALAGAAPPVAGGRVYNAYDPALAAVLVTPVDGVDQFPGRPPRYLFCTQSGNLACQFWDGPGVTVVLPVAAGRTYNWGIRRANATGTTARMLAYF